MPLARSPVAFEAWEHGTSVTLDDLVISNRSSRADLELKARPLQVGLVNSLLTGWLDGDPLVNYTTPKESTGYI